MAGIEDAIREDAIIKDAIRNYQKRGAGLPSLQLSPELLKALQVPENKGLGSVFPEETGYYDSFIKSIGGDPENPATELGKYASYPGKAIAYGAEGIISTLKGLGLSGDRISGSPLTDNLVSHLTSTPESTRQNLGQDILKQLANKTSSTMGQGSGEYLDTRGQIGDTGIEAAIGDGNIDEDALIATQKLNEAADEKARDAVLAAEDDAEANAGKDLPVSEEEKKKNAQQSLFASAMKDFNETYSGGTTKDSSRKSIDDYKKDFAEATGIDISGEPDNKLALMSLGLSLMQNRAGKGFNFSNILTSVGQAGQDALPLFEKAKADARAGQVASGKYALQETKADNLASLATAKEKRTALAALSTQFRDEKFKRQLEYIKHNNNMQIKLLENDMKPIDAKGKVTTTTLEGNNYLQVDTAFVTGSKNRVFLAPVQQAEKHANQYVGLLEAKGSIKEVQDILQELANKPNQPSAIALLEGRVLSVLKPLGIGDTDYSQGLDKIIKEGTTPEEKVEAIQARLISQYKKFLTKETGNGVSEGDIERLRKLIGEIKVGQPIAENLNRLKQLDIIFDAPKRSIESQFNSFSKRENFRNDEEYNKTMAIINKAISTGTEDLYSSSIKDGVFTIDLRKK
jgi:hypothetical protein